MDVKSLTSEGNNRVLSGDQLFEEAKQEFFSATPPRRYAPGLMMALIDFFRELGAIDSGLTSLEDFLRAFPRDHSRGKGKTLTVRATGKSRPVSLRVCYDRIERYFQDEEHRGGYPTQPNHATIAWLEYPEWFNSLLRLSKQDIDDLRERLRQFVLAQYASDEFDPRTALPRKRPFKDLLEKFNLTAVRGEPKGAALQGVVFGFLRADNPHLQVQIWKVHTGSRRKKGVGDIDCWAGKDLVISAEVKQFALTPKNCQTLTHFSDAIAKRKAIGIVAALDMSREVRQWLNSRGLIPLSLGDIANLVDLWDSRKQDTAVDSMIFYVEKIERNEKLSVRLQTFLEGTAENRAVNLASEFDDLLSPLIEAVDAAKTAI